MSSFFCLAFSLISTKGLLKGLSCLTIVFLGFAWKLNCTQLTFSFWASLCIREKAFYRICWDSTNAFLLAFETGRKLGEEVMHSP